MALPSALTPVVTTASNVGATSATFLQACAAGRAPAAFAVGRTANTAMKPAAMAPMPHQMRMNLVRSCICPPMLTQFNPASAALLLCPAHQRRSSARKRLLPPAPGILGADRRPVAGHVASTVPLTKRSVARRAASLRGAPRRLTKACRVRDETCRSNVPQVYGRTVGDTARPNQQRGRRDEPARSPRVSSPRGPCSAQRPSAPAAVVPAHRSRRGRRLHRVPRGLPHARSKPSASKCVARSWRLPPCTKMIRHGVRDLFQRSRPARYGACALVPAA